jgi:O-antigen/teichoic acid export membrane protein
MTSLPIPHALSKFIPKYGSTQKGKVIGVFRVALFMVLLIIIPITLLVLWQAEPIAEFVFYGEAETLWVQLAAFEILFFTLNQFFFAAVVGIGRSGRAGLLYSVSLILRFGLAAIFVVFGFKVTGAVIGYIIGDAALILLVAPLLFLKLKGRSEHIEIITVARFSLPLLVSSLIVFGVSQIDRIFALFQLGLPELGIYTVAVAAATIGAYAPNAFNTALVPALSSMLVKNDMGSLKAISRVYTRYVSLLGVPTAVMIAALALPLTRLFGPDYSSSALPAAIISIAVAFTSFTSVYNAQLVAADKVKWIMLANVIGLLVFTIVLTALVPISNFVGAALARSIMIFVVAAVIIYSSNKLGYFVLDVRALLSSLSASIIMGVVLGVLSLMIGGYVRQLVALVILMPSGAVIYIALLRLFKTFTVDDLTFLHKLLPNKMKALTGVVAEIAGVSNEWRKSTEQTS